MHFQRVLEYIDLYYDMGLLSMMLFFLRTVLPIYLIDSLKKVYDLLKKKLRFLTVNPFGHLQVKCEKTSIFPFSGVGKYSEVEAQVASFKQGETIHGSTVR